MSWETARLKTSTHEKAKKIAQYEDSNIYEVYQKLIDHYYDIVLEEMREEPQITPDPESGGRMESHADENALDREVQRGEFIL